MKFTAPLIVPMPLTIEPERPEIGGGAGRERVLGERRVGEPAESGCSARDEAQVNHQAAEQRDPKSEGVQPRKGHVAGADHQRHQIVADADQNRHADEEDHRRAVHREELVECVGAEHAVARIEELPTHQQRFNAADHEKHDAHQHIHDADLLVIDRRRPLVEQSRPAQIGSALARACR